MIRNNLLQRIKFTTSFPDAVSMKEFPLQNPEAAVREATLAARKVTLRAGVIKTDQVVIKTDQVLI